MPEPTPSNVTPDTPATTQKGRDTKWMLETFARALYGEDHDLAGGIRFDHQLSSVQNKIKALKDDRDSVPKAEKQVTKLEGTLEKNTTLKPETKKDLKQRISELQELIKKGLKVNNDLKNLETKLSELAAQHEAMKKQGNHTTETTLDTSGTTKETLAETLEELKKEHVNLDTQFTVLHKQIASGYKFTYDAIPPNALLVLKPFDELTKRTTEDQEEPQEPSTPTSRPQLG